MFAQTSILARGAQKAVASPTKGRGRTSVKKEIRLKLYHCSSHMHTSHVYMATTTAASYYLPANPPVTHLPNPPRRPRRAVRPISRMGCPPSTSEAGIRPSLDPRVANEWAYQFSVTGGRRRGTNLYEIGTRLSRRIRARRRQRLPPASGSSPDGPLNIRLQRAKHAPEPPRFLLLLLRRRRRRRGRGLIRSDLRALFLYAVV